MIGAVAGSTPPLSESPYMMRAADSSAEADAAGKTVSYRTVVHQCCSAALTVDRVSIRWSSSLLNDLLRPFSSFF